MLQINLRFWILCVHSDSINGTEEERKRLPQDWVKAEVGEYVQQFPDAGELVSELPRMELLVSEFPEFYLNHLMFIFYCYVYLTFFSQLSMLCPNQTQLLKEASHDNPL